MTRKLKQLRNLVSARRPDLTNEEILALILCGRVHVDGAKARHPDQSVGADAVIELLPARKYVSRGGNKLEPLLLQWKLTVARKVFIDAGCSKGGFSDCLLQQGAALVHAVDVGYNQLDYKMRCDSRVKVHEKTNIMLVDPSHFNPRPDAAVLDLSFRSIRKAAIHVLGMLEAKWLLALVKPQFEWLNPDNRFDGVVRSPDVLYDILVDLIDDLWNERSFVKRIDESPLKGRKGNREFFFLIEGQESTKKKVIVDRIADLVGK